MTNENTIKDSYLRLYQILHTLRSPEGCPWDRKQTPHSLRGDLLEETYECIEAIDDKDIDHIKEELGDILLVTTMIGVMHEEEHLFNMSHVLNDVSDKLVRRHPHVFGESQAKDADQVLEQWDQIKENQEGRKTKTVFDSIPKNLPPLERALKIQKKVSRQGFDWDSPLGNLEKIKEELLEWEESLQLGVKEHMEEELGDLLFALVNLGRKMKIDPVLALQRCNRKFQQRYQYIEKKLEEDGLTPSPENRNLMENYWSESKKADQ